MIVQLTVAAILTTGLLGAGKGPEGSETEPCCEQCECSPVVIRVFEGRELDEQRRANYKIYCDALDELWKEYRAAGSTPAAFKIYQVKASELKRDYVDADPYFVPIYND